MATFNFEKFMKELSALVEKIMTMNSGQQASAFKQINSFIDQDSGFSPEQKLTAKGVLGGGPQQASTRPPIPWSPFVDPPGSSPGRLPPGMVNPPIGPPSDERTNMPELPGLPGAPGGNVPRNDGPFIGGPINDDPFIDPPSDERTNMPELPGLPGAPGGNVPRNDGGEAWTPFPNQRGEIDPEILKALLRQILMRQ